MAIPGMRNRVITFCGVAMWLVAQGQSITIGGEKGVSIVDTPQVIVKQNARYSLWEGVDVAIKAVIDSGISPNLENVLKELDEMARQNDIKLPYSYSLSGKVSFSTKGNGKTRMEHNNVHRTLTPQNEQRKKDFEDRVAARISNILRETSPYAERITARLEREVSQMLAENLNSGSSSSIPDWMPRDTSKDAKQRFRQADFFGRDNIRRSSRFAGGYLSPEFRENFINSHMEGLNPGDVGYDAMRRKAESAWSQAVKQYDRQFLEFGQEKLKEQSRLDSQRRRDAQMERPTEMRSKTDEGFDSGSFVLEKLSLTHGEGKRYHGNVKVAFKCKGTTYPLNSRIEVVDDSLETSYELNKKDWEYCLLKADVLQILLEDTASFIKHLSASEKEFKSISTKNMLATVKQLSLTPNGHNRYHAYAEIEVTIEHDVFTRKLHIDVISDGERLEWEFESQRWQ